MTAHDCGTVRPLLILAVVCASLVWRLVQAGDPAPAVDQEFTAAVDGSIQRYVEIRPVGFDPAAPVDAVITLHGHGSDRWQYVQADRGECRGVRDVAAGRGMLLISPDYRAKTSWMGPQAEADVVQLIDILQSQYNLRRIYLVGASMGGTAALIFATLHPDLIDGVLSENGTANMVEYDQFQDAIRAAYGGLQQDVPEEYRKRSPELAAERLTMPIAMTVGGRDTLVPPDSVRRLARKLMDGNRQDVLLDDDAERGHETGYGETVAAFEFVIRAVEARTACETGLHGVLQRGGEWVCAQQRHPTSWSPACFLWLRPSGRAGYFVVPQFGPEPEMGDSEDCHDRRVPVDFAQASTYECRLRQLMATARPRHCPQYFPGVPR